MSNSSTRRAIALFATLLVTALVPSTGRITKSEVRKDERSWILLSQPFGFGMVGNVSIEVSDVSLLWPDTEVSWQETERDYTKFAFYLIDGAISTDLEQRDAQVALCNMTTVWSGVEKLFSFEDSTIQDSMHRTVSESKPVKHYSQMIIGHGGLYSLYFANCGGDAHVSFNAKVSMFNVMQSSGKETFLSVGELNLPTFYLVSSLVYLAGLIAWIITLRRNWESLHKIHALMTVLATLKVVTLVTQCGMYHYIRVTGEPDGWNIAFYTFTLFRGIMFFSVIVLIGTGWSYMVPFLGDNDKKILAIVIPLQVVGNIAIIVMDELSPARRSWLTWRDTMHLLDMICCAAVVFPILSRISKLREAAETDGKAARSIEQLKLFRTFYVAVVVYMYFTRIVVYLLQTTLPYEMTWLSTAFGELTTFCFYALTASQFRPHKQNQYLKIEEDTEMSVELTNV